MDLQKQILNAINRALFDRAVLTCDNQSSQEELFALSKSQNITALVAEGLRRSGDYESLIPEFDRLSENYLFQYVQQSVETERLTLALNQRKCSYVLLKGARMRGFYPQPHQRTSCDIDILTAESDETVCEIMAAMGYRFTVDAGTTLNFEKPPALEFEMHRRLFSNPEEFGGYFHSIWERTIPVSEGSVERVLTEEDFYVYMIAHLAKHVDKYGCGIRPLVDVYLYHQKLPATFDRKKADQILTSTGLLRFERRICALTSAWFETGVLSEADEKLTDFLFGSGLYGNDSLKAANEIRKRDHMRMGRCSLFFRYVFPPMRIMRPMYPRLLKCGIFLPIAWVMRWIRLLFSGRKHASDTLRWLKSIDDQYVDTVSGIIAEFGLEEAH